MYIICALAAFAVIGVDFAVKRYIMSNVALGDVFGHFTSLFDFVYVRNTGAAFSILSGKLWILALISVLFCIGVIVGFIVKRPKSRLLCASLTLLFAGAFANAIDRIFYGYVVDFIKTTFMNFAVFNIADIAITVGAALLVVYVIFFDSRKER